MSRWRAALPLVLLLVAGIVLFASGSLDQFTPQQLLTHRNEWQAQILLHPWFSRLAFIGLLTLTVATGIPGSIVVIMAGGFAFGVIDATITSSIGLTLGSLLLFLASRYAFGESTREPPALVARMHLGFQRHPLSYTMFLRFVPVVPFGAVTVALAWLRCPLWLFLAATWLGGTVTLTFEASIGAGLGDAMSQTDSFGLGMFLHRAVLLPLGAIAALALLPLLIKRVLQRRHRTPPEV